MAAETMMDTGPVVKDESMYSCDSPPSPSMSYSSADAASRSQVCAICNISTNSYHLNYGVSSCLSCRAFFRRIVQQKMKTQMKCKGASENNCQITPENRKKCKKCRYEACIRAGMKADAVMSEDQYKTWFRRMLRKQKKEKGDTGKSKKSPSDSGEDNYANMGSPDSYGSIKSEDRELDYMLASMEMLKRGAGPRIPDVSPVTTLTAANSSVVGQPWEMGMGPIMEPTKDDDFNLIK